MLFHTLLPFENQSSGHTDSCLLLLQSLPGQRFFVLTDDALTYAKDAHSLGPAFGGLEKNEKEYTETPLCELQDVVQDKKDRKAFQVGVGVHACTCACTCFSRFRGLKLKRRGGQRDICTVHILWEWCQELAK